MMTTYRHFFFLWLSLSLLLLLCRSSEGTLKASSSSYSSPSCNDAAAAATAGTGRLPSPIRHVLFVIAMEAEAAPFVEHLGLRNITAAGDGSSGSFFFSPQAPFHAFRGKYLSSKDDEQSTTTTTTATTVTVVTSGKDGVYGTGVDNCGTVPAALATFLALQQSQQTGQGESDVDLVINAGTCGGFARMGATVGDVYLTTAVAYHDRRIPIPSFQEYGVGRLDSSEATTSSLTASKQPLVSPMVVEALAVRHGYKTGTCTTGNSLDTTAADAEAMLSNGAVVKDMEAAAVAWSCALHDVPFLGVKVVTDVVDGPLATADEFLENLHAASQSLQEALPNVLDFVLALPPAETAHDACTSTA